MEAKGSIRFLSLFVLGLVIVFSFSLGVVLAEGMGDEGGMGNNMSEHMSVVREDMPHRESLRAVAMKSEKIHEIMKLRKKIREIFKNMTPEERRAFLLMTKEQIVKIAQEGKLEKLREEIKEREELERKGWKIRAISMREKERKFNEMREKLREINEKMKKRARIYHELKEMREQYKECLRENENQTEQCSLIREQYINKSKEYLIDTIDAAINALESAKDKVETSEYLNETQINVIVSHIDNEISLLNEIRENVTLCNNLSCLRDNAIRLKRNLKKVKFKVKEHLLKEEINRVGLIDKRADAILARLDMVLERARRYNLSEEKLQEINETVTEIKMDVEEARSKKEEAEQYYKTAQDYFAQGSPEKGKQFLEMAKDAIEEAKDKLKDANEKVQKIWNMIKHRKKIRMMLMEKSDVLEHEIEKEEENSEEE